MPPNKSRLVEKSPQSANNSTLLIEMVLIPAGPFLMGSEGWGEYENPIHEVYLDDFCIDQTPVTNEQFSQFVQQTDYRTEAEHAGVAWGYQDGRFSSIPGLSWRSYALPDREDHPVVLVSWNDASAYCQWSGKRLPTEAEWEKAARGGLPDSLYPWGDTIPDGSQCNFARTPSDLPPTTPVKQLTPNSYGVYDMVGNVWQWCADWYANDYYANCPHTNPPGPLGGVTRVRRGGSWNVIQTFRLRCANRGAMNPSGAALNVGFRCLT